MAFSINTNGRELFSCKDSSTSNQIQCLHGIRVISTVWLVVGHVASMVGLLPVRNRAEIIEVANPIYITRYSTMISVLTNILPAVYWYVPKHGRLYFVACSRKFLRVKWIAGIVSHVYDFKKVKFSIIMKYRSGIEMKMNIKFVRLLLFSSLAEMDNWTLFQYIFNVIYDWHRYWLLAFCCQWHWYVSWAAVPFGQLRSHSWMEVAANIGGQHCSTLKTMSIQAKSF